MAHQFSLIYDLKPVSLLPPAADAAGRTSPYRNIKYGDKAYIICRVNQGNAAPVSLTVFQATNVSGANEQPISAVPIWLNNATASSDAFTAQANAASFTTDATIADKIVVFEITPEAAMNVTAGFITLAVQTTASNAANITEASLLVNNVQRGQAGQSTYNN
jgi:hypothetical protein